MESKAVPRIQVNVSLSERAIAEYQQVANWLGIPVRTLIRQIVETHHQSPPFANLLNRAKSGDCPPPPVMEPLEGEED